MSDELKCSSCGHELDMHTEFSGCQYYQCECGFSQDDIYRNKINALQAKLDEFKSDVYDAQRDLERSLASYEKVDYELYISNAIESMDKAFKKLEV